MHSRLGSFYSSKFAVIFDCEEPRVVKFSWINHWFVSYIAVLFHMFPEQGVVAKFLLKWEKKHTLKRRNIDLTMLRWSRVKGRGEGGREGKGRGRGGEGRGGRGGLRRGVEWNRFLWWFIVIKRFSIECRKTRPITVDTDNPVNQSETKANACKRHQARENACEQVTISFGLTSDWLKKWREIF